MTALRNGVKPSVQNSVMNRFVTAADTDADVLRAVRDRAVPGAATRGAGAAHYQRQGRQGGGGRSDADAGTGPRPATPAAQRLNRRGRACGARIRRRNPSR
jgi:hypothetical protein